MAMFLDELVITAVEVEEVSLVERSLPVLFSVVLIMTACVTVSDSVWVPFDACSVFIVGDVTDVMACVEMLF